MRFFLWAILKLLPWEVVTEINELSLGELDNRGLIIWAGEHDDIRKAIATQATSNQTETNQLG